VYSDTSQDYSFPIVGGSNYQISGAADSQIAINWYPFYDPITKDWALYHFAGSKKLLSPDVGENPFYGRCGGCIALIDTAYFILGNQVFQIDSVFAIRNIGSINTVVGTVSMCVGGNYLLIVDGTGGWTYDIPNDDFQPVPGPPAQAFPSAPQTCCQQEGYFLVNDANTQAVFQSAFENPRIWNALNRFTVSFDSCKFSSPVIATRSIGSRVIIFTSTFIQVYRYAPNLTLAFKRDGNLVFGYGVLSQGSIAVGTSGIFGDAQPQFCMFVSQTSDGTRKIMQTSGDQPQVVSTPSIDYRLNQLTKPEECESYTWTENGQTFAVFNFRTDKQTIVYNVTNKTFFDLQYRNGERYFGQSFMFFRNKKLMTSYLDGFVYEMSENFLNNDGVPIRRVRITNNFRVSGYKKIVGNTLELYFQQGVGLVGLELPDAQFYVNGANPYISLYISKDGGQSFSEPLQASLGRVGERIFTTRFKALGLSKDWTFKIETFAPVKLYLMGANFNFTVADGSG
jgi:hypothetical protein